MTNGVRRGRWGLLAGLAGAIIGGFSWVAIAGVMIGDPRVWVTAIVAAIVVAWSAWRISDRHPANPLLVVGWTVLLVSLLDLAFLAWVLPRLPADRASLWLGTDPAFDAVRPLAVIGSASGALVLLWVFWRRRSV